MTTLNALYLALCVGSLVTFTIVVMYVTNLTNPAKQDQKAQNSLEVPAWRALAR